MINASNGRFLVVCCAATLAICGMGKLPGSAQAGNFPRVSVYYAAKTSTEYSNTVGLPHAVAVNQTTTPYPQNMVVGTAGAVGDYINIHRRLAP